ncbi:MAG: hypothetical protein GTO14_01205 [Anaerolineales bacterium]|nr:hypothetical protein [Anaerolineales bacterium]
MSLLDKQLNELPPAMANVPREIEAVIRKSLAKYPDDRYDRAGDLRRVLLRARLASNWRSLIRHNLSPTYFIPGI